MSDLRWERMGVLSGFAVAILSGVAVSVVPIAPPLDSSSAEVSAYFSDNRQALLIQGFTFMLASAAFIWFVASIRSYMARVEEGTGRLASAAFGAGITGIAASFVGTTFPVALALRSEGVVDPGLVRFAYDLTTVSYLISYLPFAVMLGATGILAFRKAAFPTWLGWIGVVGAAVTAVFSSGFLFETGPLSPGNPWGYLFFVVFGVWLVATTAVMYERLGRVESTEAVKRATPTGRMATGH